ncbi:MAG: hypothetical protein ACE5GI_01795 [Candidatus Aminicenantales bacterium]
MEVIIASDRAGFKLKERIKKYLARPFFPFVKIRKIINIWLHTPFSGQERHRRRLQKIADYEKEKS